MSELASKFVVNYKEFDKGINNYTNGVTIFGYNQMIKSISSLASGSRN